MQGIGSQFRFGQFMDTPERIQLAREAELSFFELKFYGEKRYSQNVFGFFDVKVTRLAELPQMRSRGIGPRFDIKWRTGKDAKFTYECVNQKSGLAVAFVVDDEFWHNRIYMAFSPVYHIFQYHSPNGPIEGEVVTREIDCLREVTQDKMKAFTVKNPGGKSVFNSFEEEEVDAFLKAKNGATRPGMLPPFRKMIRTVWITKPEVLALIEKYKREKYGWTSNSEFDRVVREPTLRLIDERSISRTAKPTASLTQDMVDKMVMNKLTSMTATDLKDIIRMKEAEETNAPGTQNRSPELKQRIESSVQQTPETPIPTAPAAGDSFPGPEFKPKTFFNRMRLEDAAKMAVERGIPEADQMTRSELIAALYEDECKKKTEYEDSLKLAGTMLPNDVPGASNSESENQQSDEGMVAQ